MNGENFQLPERWARAATVDGNTARQLVAGQTAARLEQTRTGLWHAVTNDGSQFGIREHGRTPEGADGLELPRAAFRALPVSPEKEDWRWVVRAPAGDPEDVLAALDGRFTLRTEDESGGRGLRIPQAGALHAVLAHWSTRSTVPVTVVLPTGTGKTETMIALQAWERLPRVLVLVPSDNLRRQIAESFETYGVLPDAGVLDPVWPGLVVGRIAHRFTSADRARAFADRCNVIVTTPSALNAVAEDSIFQALVSRCTHLFVDEAHHVAAKSWLRVRDAFSDKRVVQFTATPYRTDGEPIGGRLIYSFPLGLAQQLGYFQTIRYVSVVSFAEPDRAVADQAVAQLRRDLDDGFDHLIMARVKTIGKAHRVLELYREIAPEFGPRELHSKLEASERRAAFGALERRESRIIVCVDMLGEGFNFPELKIAALHDPHRTLGVTLQFIGRFARTRADLGTATAVVARPDPGYDERLRALYAENNQWDQVIEELATHAIDEVRDLDSFEAGFGERRPDELATQILRPKMSTVVYETSCDHWYPGRLRGLIQADDLVSGPAINDTDRVAWMVVQRTSDVGWAHLDSVENVDFHLYVLHWDQERALLYINSSDLEGVYEDLAKAVCGETVRRITEDQVYRVLGELQRPVPTNVGLLDLRSTSRRFSMHVGADVFEGFPVAEQQSKTNTHVSLTAYDKGERVTMSAARKKGRIWSHQAAPSIFHWVRWARALGPKLQDESINLDAIFRSFVRPSPLTERPALAPLAIDWPWMPLVDLGESVRLRIDQDTAHMIDAELRVAEHETLGPIRFEVRVGDAVVKYEADVQDNQLRYRAEGAEAFVIRERRPAEPLSSYLEREGTTIWFEQEVVVAGSVRYELQRELPPIELEKLVVLDWVGVNLRRESQGRDCNPATVQARAADYLIGLEDWDIVIDDDSTGEIADLVAFKDQGGHLLVHLVHCKFSSEDDPGGRLKDLYEVCGQAQRSAHHRQSAEAMVKNLIRRERLRQTAAADGQPGFSGIMVGDANGLLELADKVRQRRTLFRVTVAQPGFSKASARDRHLDLLAATDVYVSDIAYGRFDVWCSG